MKRGTRIKAFTAILPGAVILLLCGQLWAQQSRSNPFAGETADNCGPQASAPELAASAKFYSLTFCDDFNSLSTIDVNATGATGFNWYTKLPFGGTQTLPSEYGVSHSVLTVTGQNNQGWALSTRDPVTGKGHAFNFAYFEARIRFNPALGSSAPWFPAFWSLSSYHTQFNNLDYWPELDFFEAYTGGYAAYDGAFYGTLHQWEDISGVYTNWQNTNNYQPVDVDWNQWHVIGCLWVPGKITWYLDGNALMSQQYSATAPPNPLSNNSGSSQTGVYDGIDTQNMELILGSAPGWPLYVDWVRVWQESDLKHRPALGFRP